MAPVINYKSMSMKPTIRLLALALLVSFCILPIISSEVGLPYFLLLLGGVMDRTINALIGVPAVAFFIVLNVFLSRWRYYLQANMMCDVLMLISILSFFVLDTSHVTLKTFTYSIAYVLYALYLGMSILFFFKSRSFHSMKGN